MTEAKGKSPYQKYEKQPYRYSDQYRNWESSRSYAAGLAHAKFLIRTFGAAYWKAPDGTKLLPREAYDEPLIRAA